MEPNRMCYNERWESVQEEFTGQWFTGVRGSGLKNVCGFDETEKNKINADFSYSTEHANK